MCDLGFNTYYGVIIKSLLISARQQSYLFNKIAIYINKLFNDASLNKENIF